VKVYVATKNAGKLREMQALFADAPFELTTYAAYEEPAEGDVSYADNAALKAHALHAQLARAGRPGNVLADDSGLEVFALGGRPGVLTAYYGGAELPWSERRAKLIAELDATGSDDRRARFVCALHFVSAERREFATLATVDGQIAAEERGELGFSFDPVFAYGPDGRTFAELRAGEKNRVSHRAIAAKAILKAIREAFGIDRGP
jgi:XTP/dITP diphosphohydrolase